MRDFLVIWAGLYACYWAGIFVERYHSRQKASRVFPEDLTPEFKAWLTDYLAVNMPRRNP